MVEFDVQLSKDHIPVIYHDFYVSISLRRKKQIEAMDMLEIPVKDLTLEQLHLLKVLIYVATISHASCVMHFYLLYFRDTERIYTCFLRISFFTED